MCVGLRNNKWMIVIGLLYKRLKESERFFFILTQTKVLDLVFH